jgi:hypothetical protein
MSACLRLEGVERMSHKETLLGVGYVHCLEFGDDFVSAKPIQHPQSNQIAHTELGLQCFD